MSDLPVGIRAPLAAPPRGRTRSADLADRLAEEIVGGRLQPGAALDEVQLATAFGVSRTPVREALRQLATTGLIELRPHRGAVVARPAEGELHDMFLVMAELEALCAGLAAVAMSASERRALDAHHRSMAVFVRDGDVARYRTANIAFHGLVYDGAHNGYLADLAVSTRRRLAPFRGAQLGFADRLGRSHEEHGIVVAAIQRGDRSGATDAMRRHLGMTEMAWEAIRRRSVGEKQAPIS